MGLYLDDGDKKAILSIFEDENTKNIEMKIGTGNILLGRTFSLGQKLGYWVGEVISKKLIKDKAFAHSRVMIDVGISECKKEGKRAKTVYPDILIIENEPLSSFDRESVINCKKHNLKQLRKYTKSGVKLGRRDIDEVPVNAYRVISMIEIKTDAGYFDESKFDKDLERYNRWIKNRKQFHYVRLHKKDADFTTKNNDIFDQYYGLIELLIFDSSMSKSVIFGCDANAHGRMSNISIICGKNEFKGPEYLVKTGKHIRSIQKNTIDSFMNLGKIDIV